MKRKTAIVGLCLLLLFLMTAAVSGGPVGTKAKKADPVTRQVEAGQPKDAGLTTAEQSTIVINPTELESPVAAGTDAYNIPWQSINGGGGDMQSASYQMKSSVAQSVTGFASSANYQAGIGYWYGTGGGGGCECGTPFGDVNDDGGVNPVDVVYMVNYAYKGLDGRIYPTPWNCDYEIGDVNCDNGVNPVDVVYYVNFAYKAQDALCYPCGP